MSAEKVRVDKWLWSVRIFKTRTLAGNACRENDVRINEKRQKPSYLVTVGETIDVRKNGFNLQFLVKKLISKRVSATLAQECYENLTTADELNKFKEWYVGKGRAEIRQKGAGRPTKKERRTIEDFKDDQFEDEVVK